VNRTLEQERRGSLLYKLRWFKALASNSRNLNNVYGAIEIDILVTYTYPGLYGGQKLHDSPSVQRVKLQSACAAKRAFGSSPGETGVWIEGVELIAKHAKKMRTLYHKVTIENEL
jgi:hypothetical protein